MGCNERLGRCQATEEHLKKADANHEGRETTRKSKGPDDQKIHSQGIWHTFECMLLISCAFMGFIREIHDNPDGIQDHGLTGSSLVMHSTIRFAMRSEPPCFQW